MAGQHNLHNHQIAVKFPHQVWRQIEIDAEKKDMTPGEYIRWVTSKEVESIPLSSDDALIIASRIKEAEQKGKMV